jgi:hypothetical protein
MQRSNQIILRLYTMLINLNPTAHRERIKSKRKTKGAYAIITTPLRHRQEGY